MLARKSMPSKSSLRMKLTTPGDRVRAVDSGATAGHYVYAIDQSRRYRVDVDRGCCDLDVCRDMTPTIDHHQCPLHSQTTKVEKVQTGNTDAQPWVRLGNSLPESWQIVQNFADIVFRLLENFIAGKIDDRHGRCQLGPPDTGTCDSNHILAVAAGCSSTVSAASSASCAAAGVASARAARPAPVNSAARPPKVEKVFFMIVSPLLKPGLSG